MVDSDNCCAEVASRVVGARDLPECRGGVKCATSEHHLGEGSGVVQSRDEGGKLLGSGCCASVDGDDFRLDILDGSQKGVVGNVLTEVDGAKPAQPEHDGEHENANFVAFPFEAGEQHGGRAGHGRNLPAQVVQACAHEVRYEVLLGHADGAVVPAVAHFLQQRDDHALEGGLEVELLQHLCPGVIGASLVPGEEGVGEAAHEISAQDLAGTVADLGSSHVGGAGERYPALGEPAHPVNQLDVSHRVHPLTASRAVGFGDTVAPFPCPQGMRANTGHPLNLGDLVTGPVGRVHGTNIDKQSLLVKVLSSDYSGSVSEMVDVAVIGSGFGGLTAAALAAAQGARVRLLEQHTRPGGCAGDFALEGFWFPAGATVVTGLEEGGILRQVFDKLAIPVPAQPLDPSIIFHIDGREIPYRANLDEWKQTLRSAFPAAAPRYERFWDWSHSAGGQVYRIGATLPSLPIESFADVRRTAKAASPGVVRLVPDLFRTVAAVKRRLAATGESRIDGLIDALLMDATGASAAECSAVQGAIALDLYRRGCQWVDGGTARLAMQLVRSVRRDGGRVDFRTRVTSLRKRRSGWLLTLDGGERFEARAVVANVPPAGLARLRGKPVRLPRTGESWSAFVLHLGINATALATLPPFHQVVHGGEPHGNSFVSIFPSRRKGAERWSISVSRHVEPSRWRSAGPCERRQMEERMISDVEQVIPDVRDRILLRRSATPLTYERYTLRPGGFVGGLVQRPGNVALRSPGHRPERGLFLAGDHVFPGQGTVGTALSGINAYRDAMEHLGKKAAL